MGWSNSSQLLLHYKAEEVDMTTKCRFDCPLCPATLQKRRRWDSNPRWVAPHTLSRRADSSALALLLAV